MSLLGHRVSGNQQELQQHLVTKDWEYSNFHCYSPGPLSGKCIVVANIFRIPNTECDDCNLKMYFLWQGANLPLTHNLKVQFSDGVFVTCDKVAKFNWLNLAGLSLLSKNQCGRSIESEKKTYYGMANLMKSFLICLLHKRLQNLEHNQESGPKIRNIFLYIIYLPCSTGAWSLENKT